MHLPETKMRRLSKSLEFIATALAAAILGVCALSAAAAEPLYDPTQLPAFRGTLQLFTLTPRGDIDGFVLTDGLEVKTPPHLTADLAAAFKPGDRITVHGLKAASLPLIQAMSVSNDASGAAVIDQGPMPNRAPSPMPHRDDAAPIPMQGRLRMILHGPRGDINGALLEDGTVLKLPPPEATRFAGVLVSGKSVALEGMRFTTPVGTFVDLTALGPVGGPLQPIPGAPHSSLAPGAPPPG